MMALRDCLDHLNAASLYRTSDVFLIPVFQLSVISRALRTLAECFFALSEPLLAFWQKARVENH